MFDIIVADAHCDTPAKIGESDTSFQLNESRLYKGYIQFFAHYIDILEHKENSFKNLCDMIENFKKWVDENEDIEIGYNYSQIMDILDRRKTAGILSVEDGGVLQGNIDRLYILYDMGVRSITLTWNFENEIAGGCLCEKGLTDFGVKVIKEMERLGMIVDLAHLNEKSFFNAIKVVTQPPIVSHTASRAIHNNPRNLTDDQFEELIKVGGSAGVAFYPLFLNGKQEAEIADLIRHVSHFVSIGGGRGVNIGSDFDGIINTVNGIKSTKDINKVFDEFMQVDILKKSISQISSRNIIEIIAKIMKV